LPAATVDGTWIVSVDELVPPAERTTLVEAKDALGPDGETVAPRPIVPANPLMLFRATVLVPEPPT